MQTATQPKGIITVNRPLDLLIDQSATPPKTRNRRGSSLTAPKPKLSTSTASWEAIVVPTKGCSRTTKPKRNYTTVSWGQAAKVNTTATVVISKARPRLRVTGSSLPAADAARSSFTISASSARRTSFLKSSGKCKEIRRLTRNFLTRTSLRKTTILGHAATPPCGTDQRS